MTDDNVGWIGVDLDGTLAYYDGFNGNHIGDPIPAMYSRVKGWLNAGRRVKLVTARAAWSPGRAAVREWLDKHGLNDIKEITDQKDFKMIELWDDRSIAVEPNTGRILGGNPRWP